MKRFLAALFLALAPFTASAQSGKPVVQSGNVVPGQAAYWVSNGIIGSGGTAANGNITSLGIRANDLNAFCIATAASTAAARNTLCFGAQTDGGSRISSYAYGSATDATITFDINGTVQGFPTVQTLPVTINDVVCFATTGGMLKSCGGGGGGSTVDNHAVAIGTGNPFEFRSADPGQVGNVLISNGPSADPTFQSGFVITPQMFGAACDGTSSPAETAALLAWAASANANKFIPAGSDCGTTADVVLATGSQVTGIPGQSKITAFGNGFTTGVLTVTGTLTALPALSINATAGETSITFATAPTVSPDDVVTIYNPTDFSFSPWRFYYRAGEMLKVRAVSGNVVTFYTSLRASYVAADVGVYRIPQATVTLSGIHITANANVLNGISLRRLTSATIQNVTAEGADSAALLCDQTYQFRGINLSLNQKTAGISGTDYGFSSASCQDTRIEQSWLEGVRHGISHGSFDEVGSIPARDAYYVNNTIISSAAANSATDGHANAQNINYLYNTIYNGILTGGFDLTVTGNTIFGRSNGVVQSGDGEWGGGTFTFTQNRYITPYNPNTVGFPVVGFGSNGGVTANTSQKVDILFDQNTIIAPAAAGLVLRVQSVGGTVPINFDAPTLTLNTPLAVVILDVIGSATPTTSDYIQLQSVNGAPNGIAALTFTGTTLRAAGTKVIVPNNVISTAIPSNGIYIPSANTIGIATNSVQRAVWSSSGLGINGSSSGQVLIAAQAAAGTPTLTLPSTSGTFGVSATSPITLSATTGVIACATCATTSGANIPTIAQGDLLYGSAANTLSALAKSTSATRYLANTGTTNNPAWAQINLPDGVTGALPVANGGSGDTGTAWSPYTPTVTCSSGSGTITAAGRQKTLSPYKIAFVSITITITDIGTCTGHIQVASALPINSAANSALFGRNSNLARSLNANVTSASTGITVFNYDGAFPATGNQTLVISGSYETQ